MRYVRIGITTVHVEKSKGEKDIEKICKIDRHKKRIKIFSITTMQSKNVEILIGPDQLNKLKFYAYSVYNSWKSRFYFFLRIEEH